MARNIHAEVSARILAQLGQGNLPWRKPWKAQAAGNMPRNGLTKRPYSGANVPLLWLTADERGYTAPHWLTFNQALELGGNVRKGEKGSPIIFVNYIERETETGESYRVPFLKSYTVFNVAQCEGLPEGLAGEAAPINPDRRNAIADEFIAATQAKIHHGEARAYYRHAPADFINMPTFASFESADAYYSTLFHELTHWTGAEHRLNRTKGKRFGDREYAYEELVAELGAAFVCAEFGFDNSGQLDQSTAYIQSWIRLMESHETAFISAAAQASKAVEYMRGLAIAEPAPAEDFALAA